MVKKSLIFRCITYQEKDNSFTGVCLDLDIVEEGHATLQEAILSINDAIYSHMEAAKQLGFPEELIARPAPKIYWDRLAAITRPKLTNQTVNPFQFFTTQPLNEQVLYA